MRDMHAERAANDSDEAITTAVDEYRVILDHFHHSAQELMQTSAVDLVWHTHMLDPVRYGVETRALAGRFVNHEDDVTPEPLAKSQRLQGRAVTPAYPTLQHSKQPAPTTGAG